MRYMLKRTAYSASEDNQSAAEYFDGMHWLGKASAGKSFSYDEAVSRVIVLNVLDRSCTYEVVRSHAEQVASLHTSASLDDDVANSLAIA